MRLRQLCKFLTVFFTMSIMFCLGSSKSKIPKLSISETEVFLDSKGSKIDITISTNDKWKITNTASWLQLKRRSGNAGTTVITLSAAVNGVGLTRSVILHITSNNGLAKRITVVQRADLYPSYNLTPKAPDDAGMNSTAVQLAAKMNLGINIGNTMESESEGDWVNGNKVTESYIKFLKQTGFNAVRIPCSWNWKHISDASTSKIDLAWLNRVKEVVGWCVDNDMYVVLNIHWDKGWLDENINKAKQKATNAKQKALWEQIATTMRDFDEHLMYASANEPPAKDTEAMEILTSYHQTFVNAVRATGGRNSYRVLVVQGPGTDIELTDKLMNTLPQDKIPNKLMVEVHNYTPSQFTILMDGDATWGKMFYYWGTNHHSAIELDRNASWAEESEIVRLYGLMKSKFIDKGIPVIMGEYAAFKRTSPNHVPKDLAKHNESVNYWNGYATKKAIEFGLKPFFWEQGTVLDRKNNKVLDQCIIDALTK
ncbi:cellulase family glycosylhydrolase [Flavobacterium johnsoniae]|uniref:Cellulase (Glycosyl hydrolase family 5) n=1 Tax=Flavobacterium johnsoniae TaxID=986 RepID=A0A1M5QVW4_FLAJO|nr:cellulase family glycosylhydrolase [Flavobacterium johnsoniae]SHH17880.1 Cellulase (glycosyl hydrolase family 5) [Flavobacterium johnsoniae]